MTNKFEFDLPILKDVLVGKDNFIKTCIYLYTDEEQTKMVVNGFSKSVLLNFFLEEGEQYFGVNFLDYLVLSTTYTKVLDTDLFLILIVKEEENKRLAYKYYSSYFKKMAEIINDAKVKIEQNLKNDCRMDGLFYDWNDKKKEWYKTEEVKETIKECEEEIEKVKNMESNEIIDSLKKKANENIDHPAHYNHGGVETIDKIKTMLTPEEFKGFLKGNIIKYIDRADYKGHKEEDLGKADWYLRKLKEEEK